MDRLKTSSSTGEMLQVETVGKAGQPTRLWKAPRREGGREEGIMGGREGGRKGGREGGTEGGKGGGGGINGEHVIRGGESPIGWVGEGQMKE